VIESFTVGADGRLILAARDAAFPRPRLQPRRPADGILIPVGAPVANDGSAGRGIAIGHDSAFLFVITASASISSH